MGCTTKILIEADALLSFVHYEHLFWEQAMKEDNCQPCSFFEE